MQICASFMQMNIWTPVAAELRPKNFLVDRRKHFIYRLLPILSLDHVYWRHYEKALRVVLRVSLCETLFEHQRIFPAKFSLRWVTAARNMTFKMCR